MNNELISVIFWTIMIFTGGFWWGAMYAEWRRKKGDKNRVTISMPIHADEGPGLLKALSALLQELRNNKENIK